MLKYSWLDYSIGKYKIEKLLTQTQSNDFYLGTDMQTQEKVLFKIIPPSVFAPYGPDFLQLLTSNMQRLMQIHCPLLVPVYFSDYTQQHFLVIMQFICGTNIGQFLAQQNTILIEEAIYIAQQICQGLHVAHSQNLLHLDIKPFNIFVTDKREVKLTDFGLTMPLMVQGIAHPLFGNPLYIAPEQIQMGTASEKSDLYSLGATLFHMIAGFPPYQGTLTEVLQQHMGAPIPSLQSVAPIVPEALDITIQRLLAKNPQDRIPTAYELAAILQNITLDIQKPKDTISDVEKFLLEKMRLGENERNLIQNTLITLSNSQKEQNMPEEVRLLMEQVIVQEFMDHFGCDPTMIQKIKRNQAILENPKAWLDAKFTQLSQNSNRAQPTISESSNTPIWGKMPQTPIIVPSSSGFPIRQASTINTTPLSTTSDSVSANFLQHPNGLVNDAIKTGKTDVSTMASNTPKHSTSSNIIKGNNFFPTAPVTSTSDSQGAGPEPGKILQSNTPAAGRTTPIMPPDPNSKIIKSSQRIAEVMKMGNEQSSKQSLSKKYGELPKILRPFGEVTGIVEENASTDAKGMRVRQTPNTLKEFSRTDCERIRKKDMMGFSQNLSDRIARGILFLLLLSSACYAILYFVPGAYETITDFIQKQLIVFGIFTPKVTTPPEDIPNITPDVHKLCKMHQFNQAKMLIRRSNISQEERKRLAGFVSRAEENVRKNFIANLGWFGERMPLEMERMATPGEYLWPADDSIMVYVPTGEFIRGTRESNSDATPAKTIMLSSFYIDKYEVTNQQYKKYLEETGNNATRFLNEEFFNSPESPVVGISWGDTQKYAKWVGKRLPSEAEWEKACRGGITIPDWSNSATNITISLIANPQPERVYPWGNQEPNNKLANFKQTSEPYDDYKYTSPVGSFPQGSSPYLCEDMLGNVLEWCQDCYEKNYYTTSPLSNPIGPQQSNFRVCRGGDWETEIFSLRCYRRLAYYPQADYNTLGFRLVRSENYP